MKRNLIFSPEYIEFEQSSNPRTREKLRYAVAILETVQPIPTKFVKKLTNTDFYELRVSVDNEVRSITRFGLSCFRRTMKISILHRALSY